MVFNMCLVVVVNLVILFPLIRGNEHLNGMAAEEDMVSGETSDVHIQQTIHFPKMDLGKIENIDGPNFAKLPNIDDSVQNESNNWNVINSHHHNQHLQFNTWMTIVEEKLHSLMDSNQNIVNMLNELGTNLDREKHGSKELLKKVNMIQRQIDNPARKKCQEHHLISGVQVEVTNKLMKAITCLNRNLEKNSQRGSNHGDETNYRKCMEDTSNKLQSADKHTRGMYKPSNSYYPKISSSYKSNEMKRNYFSSSANSMNSPARKGRVNIEEFNKRKQGMSDENGVQLYKSRTNGIHLRMSDENQVQHEPNKYHCHDLAVRNNGIYKFASEDKFANDAGRYFSERYCDFSTDGVAWTVIQRRFLKQNQENFNRSWTDYKNGFGKLDKEFWYGNDFIHKLTFAHEMVLRIVVEDLSGREEWAEYSLFRVEAEAYHYNLQIGGYRGSIPDDFTYYDDQDFTTYDRQNDNSDTWKCAMSYGSGWWYNCSEAKLNGFLSNANPEYIGNVWKSYLGSSPVKFSTMMIRPKDVWTGEDSHPYERN